MFGIGKTDNKANFMQKMKEEKEKIATNSGQKKAAETVQRVMKGALARIRLRKEIQSELEKNLGGLETLSSHMFKQK
jgi:hypothetical protein